MVKLFMGRGCIWYLKRGKESRALLAVFRIRDSMIHGVVLAALMEENDEHDKQLGCACRAAPARGWRACAF